ncbi:MAG: hypothetical protein HOB37_07595 [Rhodospirillaceae bacterium]|nr:hypothetical protein [Rhodospirillaceae bacterium]MBT5297458.1 hypothetical protein [Rhodospirillaceae bacterium]MBT5515946.1 hypothetical protein [Rhodospirillaceae bacterium]MBT6084625.1 hypothetical protein [Rhodospirillaceae bacterium]MBT6608310.1 hypothetical protein [Rhodospirillaceae bacterium]
MTKSISVEISPGELIDKITILEIKLDRIEDTEKVNNVRTEWEILTESRDNALPQSDELSDLTKQLGAINEQLWVIEDDIRDCERARDFGEKFIELARSVYIVNDKRAALKGEINALLGSMIREEKSYAAY